MDTPPIFEAGAQDQEMYQNIGSCYLLSVPGPHVLLLVTQLGVSDHALITWLSCIALVACHAVITWLSCTTHLADHAMIM